MIFSCSEKSSDNTVIVNGKITDPTSDYVIVTLNEKSDTAKIQEDGTFYMKINIEKPYYGRIRSGEFSNIFLSPGDSVFVELDTKEFDETITYSGKGAEINNYLAEKQLLKDKFIYPQSEFFGLNEEDFMARTDSLNKVLKELNNNLRQNNNIQNQSFLKLEPKNIDYLIASVFLMYPSYYKYYSKDSTYEMSETFWNFLDTIEIENFEYWQLASYKDFFDAYYSQKVKEIYNNNEEFQNSPDGYAKADFEFIKNEMKDPALKSIQAGNVMTTFVRFYNTDSIDDLMTDFLALCKDSTKINQVNTILEKKKKIAKGMPAPNFETVDVNNNHVNLSDFKGKYVYVDFWASWCGPCKQEIPYFKTLTSDFNGKNIAFLSVSVDAKKDAWEKAIVTHDLFGNLLYAGSNDIIRNEYMVYSIPRFVLIDPEGNFVDSNAPRPSSEEIRNLFAVLI